MKKNLRLLVVLSALFCSISSGVLAQEAQNAPEPVGEKKGFSAGIGTVTVDGKQWQRLSFRPEIPLGKIGVSLDIELFVDADGKFSKKGWEFKNSTEAIESILRKIYYIRYGRPGQKTFVKIGALDNVTLGYGLIMDNYCNTVEYPGIKKIGAQFQFRDISPFRLGIEGMVNDFSDFKDKGAVVGARVSAAPVAGIEFGASYVIDINEFSGLKDRDGDDVPDGIDPFSGDKSAWTNSDLNNPIYGSRFSDNIPDYTFNWDTKDTTWVDMLDVNGDNIYDDGKYRELRDGEPFKISENKSRASFVGFDVGVPILPILTIYGQYAKLNTGSKTREGGWGIGAPGVKFQIGPFLTARIEYRRFSGRFRAEYFDNLYELDRVRVQPGNPIPITKSSTLDSLSNLNLNGVFGEARMILDNFVGASARYQYLTGDKTDQNLQASAYLLQGVLQQIPKLGEVSVYYKKYDIDTKVRGFFKPTTRMYYGYRLGMKISEGAGLVWDTRYTYTLDKNGDFKVKKIMNIETVLYF